MIHGFRTALATLVAAAILIPGVPAWAETKQKDDGHTFDAMTVTAQKQEENVQKVPIGMTLLNSMTLEDRKIENAGEVADNTPSLMLHKIAGGFVVPSMRGIAATPEALSSPVGMFIDGVPLLSSNGFQADLIDVERVEVLRGPQSTLYGKGAETGVINIISKRPGNEFQGTASLEGAQYLSGEGGEQLKKKFNASLSGPISEDKLFFSLAGQFVRQDGFMKNEFTNSTFDDRDDRNFKGQLLWTPTNDFEATLILSHTKKDGDGNQANSYPGAKYRIVNSDLDPRHVWKNNTASLKLKYDINDTFSVQSVTTKWVDQRVDVADMDFTPFHFAHSDSQFDINRTSQELRLNFDTPSLKGVFGAYYDNDSFSVDSTTTTTDPRIPGGVMQDLDTDISGHTIATFTNMTYFLTDKWSVNGGLRWGRDVREYEDKLNGVDNEAFWSEISPRLGVQYQIVPEAMLYANVAKGYRSGNFSATVSREYDPETLWSYEIGAKSMLFDNRLMLNANIYYMMISDMQVREQRSPNPADAIYTNAAKATGKGFEIEAMALLTDEITLNGGFSYNSTTFDEYKDAGGDYKGNSATYAPEYTFNVGSQYRHANGFFVRGEVIGYGKMYFDRANKFARDPYALVNARIGYEWEHVDVYLYGKNIFDTRHDFEGEYEGSMTMYNEPGQVGVQMGIRF